MMADLHNLTLMAARHEQIDKELNEAMAESKMVGTVV